MNHWFKNLMWWIGLGAAVVTYAFTTFATKQEINGLARYMERIEDKLDRVLEEKKK